MGTHPIFESDFDCLTDCRRNNNEVKSATKMPEQNTRNRPGARMLPSNRLPNLKDRLEVKPERNKATRALNINWSLSDGAKTEPSQKEQKKNPLPHLQRHRDYMHPDEVRKRERELLPPLRNSPTQGAGDPKGAKRAKSEI